MDALKTDVRIGVISDTHGHLPQAALDALKGVELIIHAGDIGEPLVYSVLERTAPVVAVRGNMDRGSLGLSLPEYEVVEVGDVQIYVRHDQERLDLDPRASGFDVVITGHTHRPTVRRRRSVLYLNPGSACFPRGTHAASVALLHVCGKKVDAAIVSLG